MTKIVKEKAKLFNPLFRYGPNTPISNFPFSLHQIQRTLSSCAKRVSSTPLRGLFSFSPTLFSRIMKDPRRARWSANAPGALSLFILVEPRTRSYGRIRLHYPPPPVVNHWENERKPRARALLREQQRRERASERLYKREPFIVCIKATLVNLRCKVCVYVHR